MKLSYKSFINKARRLLGETATATAFFVCYAVPVHAAGSGMRGKRH